MGAIGMIASAPFLKIETRRRWQLLGALVLAVVLMMPWMLDSYHRFGDPLGLSVFSEDHGRDPTWFRPSKILQVAVQAWRTFWGDVGPGGIDAIPWWLAAGLAVMEIVALAGIVRWGRRAWRRQPPSHHRPVAGVVGAVGHDILRLDFPAGASDHHLGRPQLPISATGQRAAPRLRPAGMGQSGARRSRHRVGGGVDPNRVGVGPSRSGLPYAATRAAHRAPAAPIARFGSQYALLDWQTRPAPGKVDVKFSLAKVGPDDRPRAYFIQIVTPGGELLANLNTYPAYGALSTGYLPQGTVLHESYELKVAQPIPSGSRLLLGLWAPPDAKQRLPAFDAAGHPLPDSAYAAPWPSP